MASNWPPHEFQKLVKKDVLYLGGRKFLSNKETTKDDVTTCYLYCSSKPLCKASARAVWLEGNFFKFL